MKKSLFISALILCCCAVNTSCGHTDNYQHDKSLTGTISYGYRAEIEGTFDGKPLIDGGQYRMSVHMGKLSKKNVSFDCGTKWIDDTTFRIEIPELSVSGKPYDVTFDYVSPDATIMHNDAKYKSVSTSIKGWMKEGSGFLDTRSPKYPIYDCDITINCTIDGKELNLKITKLIGEAF